MSNFEEKRSNLCFSNFGSPRGVPAPGTGPHANFQAPYDVIQVPTEVWTPGRCPRRPDPHNRVCLTLQRFLKKNLSDRKCRSCASCRCGQQGTCTFCKQNKMSIFYRHWCTVKKMKWFLSLSKEGGGQKGLIQNVTKMMGGGEGKSAYVVNQK